MKFWMISLDITWYIKSYFWIRRKIENNRLVKSVKCCTKVICQLVKHTEKLHTSNQDIELKPDSGKIINPQNVDHTMNSSCYILYRRPFSTK